MAGIKPNNVIRIPCTKDSIFRYWLDILISFHHLTSRETDVATAFLKERYKLSKVILDNDLIDRTLMSEDSQRKLRQECGLTNQHFQVIKSKLKNKETAESCINEVLYRFQKKHKFYGNEYEYRAMLEYVAPYIVNNTQLIELIFGCAYNAGDCENYRDYLIPACIAGIILQQNAQAVESLIFSLSHNMYLFNTTIGDLLRRSLHFIEVVSNNSELNETYFVTPDVKDVMLTSIDAINNAEERADCMVTILSLKTNADFQF